MSDSSRPHELQHARPPCPSPTPGVHPNPCPSSWWYHPAISSSVVPFSSCLQSFPALGSFPMSQLFTWGGQSIGVSASASVIISEHPGLISFRMDWFIEVECVNSCELEINLKYFLCTNKMLGTVLSPGGTKRYKMERVQFKVESLGLES